MPNRRLHRIEARERVSTAREYDSGCTRNGIGRSFYEAELCRLKDELFMQQSQGTSPQRCHPSSRNAA